MFGIFVQYSTRPIYDVGMNLFCWAPSVDIFNILPGFLWQPLLRLLLLLILYAEEFIVFEVMLWSQKKKRYFDFQK